MRNCMRCHWCRLALDGKHLCMCALNQEKRFDHPKNHGWLCKNYRKDIMLEEQDKKRK